MAQAIRKLYIDKSRGALVESNVSRNPVGLPPFVQGDTYTLYITLLEPNPSGGLSAPYTTVSVSGLSLKAGIGTPTASTGSSNPGIYQNTFTANATQNRFEGTLYIDPATVAAALGSAVSGESTLEIEVNDSGNYDTVLTTSVTLKAELMEAGAPGAAPAGDAYVLHSEGNSLYVKREGAAGEGFILTSPDGTKQLLVYCGDDGSFHADPLT